MASRTILVTVGLAVLAACGGGGLTLSEYSSQVADVIETLDSRLDAEGEAYFAALPSVEGLHTYLAIRVDGYRDAVDDLDDLAPPTQAQDLHDSLAEILSDLLVAEQARAASATTIDSVEDLPSVWESPESEAVSRAEERAIVLCCAAQTEFESTHQREELADVPWIPADLKDVVNVALDCP